MEIRLDAFLVEFFAEQIHGRLPGVLRDDYTGRIEIQGFEGVQKPEYFLVVTDSQIAAGLGLLNVVGVDTDDQFGHIFEFRQKLDLVVGLISGQYARGVEVFKHLAAEFQVQLSVKVGNPLQNLFALQFQILCGIERNFSHTLSLHFLSSIPQGKKGRK